MYPCSERLAALERLSFDDNVTLYRMGDHIDVARGPLIGNTAHVGRFNVTAVSAGKGLIKDTVKLCGSMYKYTFRLLLKLLLDP